ncbi:DNA polymerase III subunit epsilon [Candidatus Sneabacter namystus]|uniref:DNA polymerase III subunit epsilon n=1 Tax=Candidatus Sneabacter namystus TaxID=2601646 RepID=A0A5C0UKQ6_9RICK|nr:DNA polymerase III subunit epsilon [Candidatus Sneabacter namystus]QEK39434.1 DNA polymerase III subunit epsilon [Candidatus Sneabacter namystus]
MSREVILDTETTGLAHSKGHRVIEIGAVELLDKVPTGKKFQCYINPQREITEESYKIHGLSSQFLKNKPLFADIADKFLHFVQDAPIVIHNAKFDMGFLNNELSIINKSVLPFERAIDTLAMAREMFPKSKVSLDALCKRFKICTSHRELHGALKDAELLAMVYIEMTAREQVSLSLMESSYKMPNGVKIDKVEKLKVMQPTAQEEQEHNSMVSCIENAIWRRCNKS